MARILITDGMDKSAIAKLQELGHEVVEQFYEADQLGAAMCEFDAMVVRSKTKLRAKLSKCDSFEIQTVHGLGYKAVIK